MTDETQQAGPRDREANRFTRRVARYTKVGANVGGVAARLAGARIFGLNVDKDKNAADLAAALGGLKGPIMKVAQLISTIPEALPAEYVNELSQLQNQAPAMGWPFVKRRMAAELGEDWQEKFARFEHAAAASASLGQVHRATAHDGRDLACKLQYPDMASAVEADLNQLRVIFSIHRRMNPAIDTAEIITEISDRIREELDYRLEARHMALYARIFADEPLICVPQVLDDLTTQRLLTMSWLEGRRLLSYKERPLRERNTIARAMFRAWWYPFSQYGVIHGDPHLGNYTIFEDDLGQAAGINLLDYGCIRTFAPKFVQGVIDLRHGLQTDNRELMVHAYETWGFVNLSNDVIDILNIWANFIYGPLLDDRERVIAEGISPGEYGRKEFFAVHQGLREKGPVMVPREFVFMDRAAIGLGGVFLHLGAEQNWYEMFEETIEGFESAKIRARQERVFGQVGVPMPR